jgi:hypothetical protein
MFAAIVLIMIHEAADREVRRAIQSFFLARGKQAF